MNNLMQLKRSFAFQDKMHDRQFFRCSSQTFSKDRSKAQNLDKQQDRKTKSLNSKKVFEAASKNLFRFKVRSFGYEDQEILSCHNGHWKSKIFGAADLK